MKRLILLFILCYFSACQTKQEISNDEIKEKQKDSEKSYEEKLKELEYRALNEGDYGAYEGLHQEYIIDAQIDADFLYIALIMANKYDYEGAHMDVVYCLTESYFPEKDGVLDSLDEKTKEMVITYLKNGARTGHSYAKEMLGRLYIEGKNVEKNEELGKKLVEEAFN